MIDFHNDCMYSTGYIFKDISVKLTLTAAAGIWTWSSDSALRSTKPLQH